MKTGLPKFLLLTDPYNSLEGRILILKAEFPVCVFELNRADDPASRIVKLNGKEYHVLVHQLVQEPFAALNNSQYNEVVRWYHFSSASESEQIGE